jgi:hypothetical protein
MVTGPLKASNLNCFVMVMVSFADADLSMIVQPGVAALTASASVLYGV